MKIVYPEIINYDYMFQRPAQMLRALSRKGIETIFMNKNITGFPGAKMYEEKKEVEPNHFVYPGTYPLEDLTPFILYYTYPPHIYLKDRVEPEYTIFDSIDSPTGIFSFWNPNGEYKASIKNADLVLASAKCLYQYAQKHNDNVLYVPNACDYHHFKPKPKCIPREMRTMGPNITYCGSIAEWVDIELIIEASEEYPDYNFFIIGGKLDNLIEDNDYENIHCLGHKKYKNLPMYLHASDLLLIPFKEDNPVIKATNPVKLWEYLAVGKPILSTHIPEVLDACWGWGKQVDDNGKEMNPLALYGSPVYFAGGIGDDYRKVFVNSIKSILEEPKMQIKGYPWSPKKGRRQIAKRNTWNIRASLVMTKLEEAGVI